MNTRMVRRNITAAFLVAAGTLLGACTTIQRVERLTVDQAIDLAVSADSTDSAFFALNRVIPAFGGLYRDAEGTVIVALTDVSQGDAARPLIESYLGKRNAIEGASPGASLIRFTAAKLTWFDLDEYKSRLVDVLSLPNTSYLDADEVCNCITIAVSQNDARAAVASLVEKSGVPSSAVRVIVRPRMIPAVSLQDEFRPTKGGISIKMNMFLGFGGHCTEMAVAMRAGKMGFITDSHCTRTQGGVESTEFYQAGRFLANDFVATETVDPPWIASLPSCPAGMRCRRSDSAFAEFAVPSNGALGKIALPVALCTTAACPLDLRNATDELSIVGLAGAPIVGDVRSKIGRTTGHTRGSVTATCVESSQAPRSIVDPSNFTVLCQHLVGAAFDHGDSGSPVFSLLPGNRAVLAGIAWGFDNAGNYIFSAISDVEAELGPLSLVDPATVTSAPPTQTTPSSRGVCEADRDDCMREVARPHGPRPQQCIRAYRGCKRAP